MKLKCRSKGRYILRYKCVAIWVFQFRKMGNALVLKTLQLWENSITMNAFTLYTGKAGEYSPG